MAYRCTPRAVSGEPDRSSGCRRGHKAAEGWLVLDLTEEIGERLQALQVVDRQKLVDVRHGRAHALGERLVAGRAEEWIEPDETAAGALQASHLPTEQLRVTPVPAIADDHHRRPGAEDAPRPLVIEALDRLADARPPGPVLDRVDDLRQRGIDVPPAQLAGDPRQAGTEDEDLGVFQTLPQCVDEAQEQPGVAVHRARDVTDDHQGAGADLTFLATQLER